MNVQERPPTAKGPEDWFTGDVWIDPVAQGQGDTPMSVGSVHFTPCARTGWHHHTIGQTLYVTEGEGRFQSRGTPVIAIRPGDVIRIAGNEEHWHGAATDHFMTHLAITEGETIWADPVTDTDYAATPS
ncbi:(R)-mandelonitrile lyase [Aquihabitans sp. McL0605]|uniref:(R)-mandelonitrile lyase n=1 Tax=Aquihabitans sp. McL0605 TaxID=3415671 RepID=UPI003CE81706